MIPTSPGGIACFLHCLAHKHFKAILLHIVCQVLSSCPIVLNAWLILSYSLKLRFGTTCPRKPFLMLPKTHLATLCSLSVHKTCIPVTVLPHWMTNTCLHPGFPHYSEISEFIERSIGPAWLSKCVMNFLQYITHPLCLFYLESETLLS